MIIQPLIDFGLTEKEARAYVALLSLEIGNAQEIATAAGINRSTAYVSLESLKKQGFVSVSDEKNVRRYVATPPEVILRTAEDNAVKQDLILKKISDVLPEMKALSKNTKKKPLIKVFEGEEGMKSAANDLLTTREKMVRMYASSSQQFTQKRSDKNIKLKSIEPEIDTVHYGDEVANLEGEFPASLAIYDDKISYNTENTTLIIENSDIAVIMKKIFDLAFEEVKRSKKTRP